MKKESFGNLLNQAKSANSNKTIQRVVPEKSSKLENETQFSFYIDKGLLKKLKLEAIDQDKSIKELINESIKKNLF